MRRRMLPNSAVAADKALGRCAPLGTTQLNTSRWTGGRIEKAAVWDGREPSWRVGWSGWHADAAWRLTRSCTSQALERAAARALCTRPSYSELPACDELFMTGVGGFRGVIAMHRRLGSPCFAVRQGGCARAGVPCRGTSP